MSGYRIARPWPRRSIARPSASPSTARRYSGFAGDTLASALLANGVHLMGRSFKYHRPRGVVAAGSEEPNALVTGRATTARYDAEPARDPGGALRRARRRQPEPLAQPRLRCRRDQRPARRRCFSAGFYYKTFMWPRTRFWDRLYEPLIRRAAGLGGRRPSPTPTATPAASRTATCWSSAPARPGLPRRWRAGRAGRASSSCDEQAEIGGSLLAEPAAMIDGKPAGDWLARHARRPWRARPTCGCCRAPRRSATTTRTWSASPSG